MKYQDKQGNVVDARPTTATDAKDEFVESPLGGCSIPLGTMVVTDKKGIVTFPSDVAFKEQYTPVDSKTQVKPSESGS